MYRARDRIDNAEWVARLTRAADGLDLGSEARSNAVDLFCSNVPSEERSKPRFRGCWSGSWRIRSSILAIRSVISFI